MSFPYKKIAVFGATSGIGWALAERFIENNIFVIALGRRKERLAELVQKHGHDKVQACPCDLMAMDSIPNLVINLTSTHPDLDLVFLNSGVQYGHDFTKPESVSLEHIQSEFTLNYISQIAVTKAFLPFLLSRAKEGKHAGLMYTSSGLSMVPIPTVPNYCATKAALHSFLMTLRIQLRDTGVKVIEIFPPAVQTELHGEHGKNVGMPLPDFINDSWGQLTEGKDQVPVGMAKNAFDTFELKRQEIVNKMAEQISKSHHVEKGYDQ